MLLVLHSESSPVSLFCELRVASLEPPFLFLFLSAYLVRSGYRSLPIHTLQELGRWELGTMRSEAFHVPYPHVHGCCAMSQSHYFHDPCGVLISRLSLQTRLDASLNAGRGINSLLLLFIFPSNRMTDGAFKVTAAAVRPHHTTEP